MKRGRKRVRPTLAAGDKWQARAETRGDHARFIHQIEGTRVSYAGHRRRVGIPYGAEVTNKTCSENAFLLWVERTRATTVEEIR